MSALNIDSTPLLTSILPGISSIFAYLFPEIVSKVFEFDSLSQISSMNLGSLLSPSVLILITAAAVVTGKITNFIRIKILYVPNWFKRTVYLETNDVRSLSRIERIPRLLERELSAIGTILGKLLLAKEFKKIAAETQFSIDITKNSVPERDYLATPERSRTANLLFSGEDFLDLETRQQIIDDIREKYDLNNTTNPETFYSILLNDISDTKSKETNEIESVYLFYKNTAISFLVFPIGRMFVNIPQTTLNSRLFLVSLSIFGIIMLFYAGGLGIGKIYVNQIFLEYHIKNKS